MLRKFSDSRSSGTYLGAEDVHGGIFSRREDVVEFSRNLVGIFPRSEKMWWNFLGI